MKFLFQNCSSPFLAWANGWVRTKLEEMIYHLAATVTYAFFVLETNLHLIRLMFSAIHPRPNLPGRVASPLL
jgi:hypothetical protein